MHVSRRHNGHKGPGLPQRAFERGTQGLPKGEVPVHEDAGIVAEHLGQANVKRLSKQRYPARLIVADRPVVQTGVTQEGVALRFLRLYHIPTLQEMGQTQRTSAAALRDYTGAVGRNGMILFKPPLLLLIVSRLAQGKCASGAGGPTRFYNRQHRHLRRNRSPRDVSLHPRLSLGDIASGAALLHSRISDVSAHSKYHRDSNTYFLVCLSQIPSPEGE